MLKKKKTNNKSRKKIKIPKCYFCESDSNPNYKDTLVLRRFITERGKIVAASRSGICSKHQRTLSSEIKKARFMALIPYTEGHAL
ncbi:30S ribosomal protein S18 [candidate division WWE3 bacterium]|jgi:small subunit ribosomal protein S18|nr:30S ribosomal protein S18 [candidate division WWE3 bacterium]MBT7350723.1 30S ribosomal protein S18 [candidate division WWE3 bacterium]